MKRITTPFFLTTILLTMLGWDCFTSSGHSQPKVTSMDKSSSQKILIVLTSNQHIPNTDIPTGYWLKEAALPWKIFTDAGIQVVFASPKGGKAPVDQNSLHYLDSISSVVAQNPEFVLATATTVPLSEIIPGEYDGVLYIGGHGPLWDFPKDPYIAEVTTKLYENNKVIGAVCHGLAALVNIKLSNGKYLVDGHAITSITNEEENTFERTDLIPFFLETTLVERAGTYTKVVTWQPHVEVSGRLVTGQNPASAEGVAKSMLVLLKGSTSVVSQDRFWTLMKSIGEMGKFIAAVPNGGASANLLGTFIVEHDGKENVFQLIEGKDHIHLYPSHLAYIQFTYLDVGYGPEPCMIFFNHKGSEFLKLYYMGGSKADKQKQLIDINKDVEFLFKGEW